MKPDFGPTEDEITNTRRALAASDLDRDTLLDLAARNLVVLNHLRGLFGEVKATGLTIHKRLAFADAVVAAVMPAAADVVRGQVDEIAAMGAAVRQAQMRKHGGHARHAETSLIKATVQREYIEHGDEYPKYGGTINTAQFARGVIEKYKLQGRIKAGTICKWCADWAKGKSNASA